MLWIHLKISVLVNSSNDIAEVLVIKTENFNLVTTVIYKQQDARSKEFIDKPRTVESFLDSLGNPVPNRIFLGDLDQPNIRWKWL